MVSGKAIEAIPEIIQSHQIDALYRNESYGTGHEQRDRLTKEYCTQQQIPVHEFTDYLILPRNAVPARKVYTPFYKKRIVQVREKKFTPQTVMKFSCLESDLPVLEDSKDLFGQTVHDCRKIENLREELASLDLETYDETRNIPSNTEGTTKLSPHLAFGTISPREVYTHFLQLDHA